MYCVPSPNSTTASRKPSSSSISSQWDAFGSRCAPRKTAAVSAIACFWASERICSADGSAFAFAAGAPARGGARSRWARVAASAAVGKSLVGGAPAGARAGAAGEPHTGFPGLLLRVFEPDAGRCSCWSGCAAAGVGESPGVVAAGGAGGRAQPAGAELLLSVESFAATSFDALGDGVTVGRAAGVLLAAAAWAAAPLVGIVLAVDADVFSRNLRVAFIGVNFFTTGGAWGAGAGAAAGAGEDAGAGAGVGAGAASGVLGVAAAGCSCGWVSWCWGSAGASCGGALGAAGAGAGSAIHVGGVVRRMRGSDRRLGFEFECVR